VTSGAGWNSQPNPVFTQTGERESKMQDSVVTYDMADFGSREMSMATDLMVAYRDQRPDWLGDGVKVAMNKNSGCVFLSDEDYNTAMMNGDKLEMWLFTPYDGHQGFLSDLLDEYKPDDLNADDARYLCEMIDLLDMPDDKLPKEWIAAKDGQEEEAA
jgi:hypothetical protein